MGHVRGREVYKQLLSIVVREDLKLWLTGRTAFSTEGIRSSETQSGREPAGRFKEQLGGRCAE